MVAFKQKYVKLLSFLLLFSIVLAITPIFFASTSVQPDSIEMEVEFSISEEESSSKSASDDDICLDVEYFYYTIRDNFFTNNNGCGITTSAHYKCDNPHADLLLPPPEQA